MDDYLVCVTGMSLQQVRQIYKKGMKIFYTCERCGKEVTRTLNRPDRIRNIKYCHQCRTIETNLERYGCECVLSNENSGMRERIAATNLEKYGNTNAGGSQAIQEKIKATTRLHYGVDNYWLSQQNKDKLKESYYNNEAKRRKAVEKRVATNKAKSPEVKAAERAKRRATCMAKYGVPNNLAIPEVNERIHLRQLEKNGTYLPKCKTYEYHGIVFDSSWELIFFLYCKEKGIDCKRNITEYLTYNGYNGKLKKYFPDFIVEGRYVEIKGKMFFDENGKLTNPFSKNEADQYDWKAKYQCMVDNNVEIITDIDKFKLPFMNKAFLCQYKRKHKKALSTT